MLWLYFDAFLPSEVCVDNRSSKPISRIVVSTAGQRFWIERVGAGEQAVEKFRPLEDSSLRMEYLHGDDRFVRVCVGDVYVTNAKRSKLAVVVGEDGICEVIDRTFE
ncbi:MAG: hypothetical protein NVV60_11160 [Luteimonas sp.]|nr:hypothetical protein [Luteimonas sp.]